MSALSVSLSQLESHLWESANILRGPVDAADFKTYIFPLLFFKHICDIWCEEHADITVKTSDDALVWFPESKAHRLKSLKSAATFDPVKVSTWAIPSRFPQKMREHRKCRLATKIMKTPRANIP